MCDDATIAATASFGAGVGEGGDRPAALVVIAGELGRPMFDLDRPEVHVGRGEDADIRIAFPGVSRRHAVFRAVGEADFELADLESKNGSFVNDARVEAAVLLKKGDVIKIGPVAFTYLPKGDPERIALDTLNFRVNIDRFTGCFNKSYFNERIEQETRASAASGGALALIVFDLDHFKHLNDGHGHDAGDFVLKQLAALVREGLRRQDVFARHGGEEFAILMPGLGLDAALEVAATLRRRIEEFAFEYEGRRLPVTASLGVAAYGQEIGGGAEFFKLADAALYQAKQAGRNRVQAARG